MRLAVLLIPVLIIIVVILIALRPSPRPQWLKNLDAFLIGSGAAGLIAGLIWCGIQMVSFI